MSLRIEPPAFVAAPALRAVLTALPRARLVGGCVRDSFAGTPVSDIDLATPDAPDQVIAALDRAGLRAIPTGIAHGTVTALSDKEGFEVTTLRRDSETDGRHAVVTFTDDWQEDAARRDFTINAMSMTADGEVFDYFGGVADLRAGIVRFVGDPATRIAEDYLRILRFFRFFARYGTGTPDAPALHAIAEAVPGLARLSGERVWSELRRVLEAPAPDEALSLMRRSGVLRAVLPESLSPVPVDGLPVDPVLRLAALVPDGPVSLKLSSEQAARLAALQGPSPPAGVDDATLRRMLADTAPEILAGRAWIAAADGELRRRIAEMPVPVFPLQGRDLAMAGVLPGPRMGVILRALRAWWWEGGCTASREDIVSQLSALLAERTTP